MYEELVKKLRDLPHLLFVQLYGHEDVVYKAANVIEELSKPQNTVHLCESCKYQYPECPADVGVVFGTGKGNDNICQCADYVARIPCWIPVTERLPETYTWVLVYAEKHEVAFDAYYDGSQWKDALLNGLVVTHWMPLPEPPKEEI